MFLLLQAVIPFLLHDRIKVGMPPHRYLNERLAIHSGAKPTGSPLEFLASKVVVSRCATNSTRGTDQADGFSRVVVTISVWKYILGP